MTATERKIVFIHSTLCSLYNELNHTLSFFRPEEGEGLDPELQKVQPLVLDAYLAAEKAAVALARLADKHTNWDE